MKPGLHPFTEWIFCPIKFCFLLVAHGRPVEHPLRQWLGKILIEHTVDRAYCGDHHTVTGVEIFDGCPHNKPGRCCTLSPSSLSFFLLSYSTSLSSLLYSLSLLVYKTSLSSLLYSLSIFTLFLPSLIFNITVFVVVLSLPLGI